MSFAYYSTNCVISEKEMYTISNFLTLLCVHFTRLILWVLHSNDRLDDVIFRNLIENRPVSSKLLLASNAEVGT